MGYKVEKFPPHQNAKVTSILMAIASFIFIIPLFILMILFFPEGERTLSVFMVVSYPIIYLIIGYISVFVSCWIYNRLQKYTGGFEFVLKDEQ